MISDTFRNAEDSHESGLTTSRTTINPRRHPFRASSTSEVWSRNMISSNFWKAKLSHESGSTTHRLQGIFGRSHFGNTMATSNPYTLASATHVRLSYTFWFRGRAHWFALKRSFLEAHLWRLSFVPARKAVMNVANRYLQRSVLARNTLLVFCAVESRSRHKSNKV